MLVNYGPPLTMADKNLAIVSAPLLFPRRNIYIYLFGGREGGTGSINEEVGLSHARWSNLNIRVTLALIDLFRVSDLGLAYTTFTPKYPSGKGKPVNQPLSAKFDLSNKLSCIFKEYL